jgi:hypothetical protein
MALGHFVASWLARSQADNIPIIGKGNKKITFAIKFILPRAAAMRYRISP